MRSDEATAGTHPVFVPESVSDGGKGEVTAGKRPVLETVANAGKGAAELAIPFHSAAPTADLVLSTANTVLLVGSGVAAQQGFADHPAAPVALIPFAAYVYYSLFPVGASIGHAHTGWDFVRGVKNGVAQAGAAVLTALTTFGSTEPAVAFTAAGAAGTSALVAAVRTRMES